MSNILKQFENGEPCWLLVQVSHDGGKTTEEEEEEEDDWSVSSLGSDCLLSSSESGEDSSTLSASMSSLSNLSDHDNNFDVNYRNERSLSSLSRWDSGSKEGSQCWSTKLAADHRSGRQRRQSKKIMTNGHEELDDSDEDEGSALCSQKPTQRQASLLALPPRLGRLQRQSLRSIYSNGSKPKNRHDHDGEQSPLIRRSQTLSPATRATTNANAKSFQEGRGGPTLRRRQTTGSTSRSSSLQKCSRSSSKSLQQWQLLNRPQDILKKKKQQASGDSRFLQSQLVDLPNTTRRRVMKTTSSSTSSSSGSNQVAPRRSVTLDTILPSSTATGQAAIMLQGVAPALRRSKTTGTPLKEWQGRRMRRHMAELPVTAVQVVEKNRNTAASNITTTMPLPTRANISTTSSSNPSSVSSSLPVRGLIRGPPRLRNSTRSLNKLLVRNRTIERKPSSGALSEATQERIRQSLLSTTTTTSCATSTTMKNVAWATEQGSPSGTIKLGIAAKARLGKTQSMPHRTNEVKSSSSDKKCSSSSSSKKSPRKTQSLQEEEEEEEEDGEQRPITKSLQDTLRETLSLVMRELDDVPVTTTSASTSGWAPAVVVHPKMKVISVRPTQKPSPTRVKTLNDDDGDACDDSAIPGSRRLFAPCSPSSGQDLVSVLGGGGGQSSSLSCCRRKPIRRHLSNSSTSLNKMLVRSNKIQRNLSCSGKLDKATKERLQQSLSTTAAAAAAAASLSVIHKNAAWLPQEKQSSTTSSSSSRSRLVAKRVPVRQPDLLAALRDDFKNVAAASATTRNSSRGCAA